MLLAETCPEEQRPWPPPQGDTTVSVRENVCGWKFVAHSRLQSFPSAIGCWSLSVLKLCQDCKIFLMTGHIPHLDSMVITARSFLSSLVEVIMIESWVAIAAILR